MRSAHRVGPCRPPGRDEDRDERDHQEQKCNREIGLEVIGPDPVEEASESSRQSECPDKTDAQAHSDEHHPTAENLANDVTEPSAQSHAEMG